MKECDKIIKEEIQKIIKELAEKWIDIFDFGDLGYDPSNRFNIQMVEMKSYVVVKFEYCACCNEWDYWEQYSGPFESFNNYPALPGDRLILTYEEIDNRVETIKKWKIRKNEWIKYHKNKLREEKNIKRKVKESREKKLYEKLKKKYEKEGE